MTRSRNDPGYAHVPQPSPATDTDPQSWRCFTMTIPDDPDYLLQLKTALDGLRHWENYRRTGNTAGSDTAKVWRSVLDAVEWDYDTCWPEQPEEGEGCQQIGAFHPAITYTPNHPKFPENPNVPYDGKVWVQGGGLYLGTTEDDAVLEPLAWISLSLADAIAAGLPSAEISFSGVGEVDIGFVGQIQGGMAWVFPDGNPLLGDLVDLQHIDLQEVLSFGVLLDLLELVGQGDYQIFEVVHTMTFDTPGDHTITAWFMPAAEVTPPYIGLGGALRYVQFCGDIQISEDEVMAFTLLRTGDTLELLADGVPVSAVSLPYVDEAGDTMTGPLIHDTADGTYQDFKTEGGAIASLLEDDGILSIVSEVGKKIALRSQDANTSILQVQPERITLRGGAAAAANSGNIRLSGSGGNGPVVGIRTAGQDLIALIGPSSEIIGEWTPLGIARGPGYHGYGRSSTDAWRKQFALDSSWVDDTDATRKAGAILSITDYIGDIEMMRAHQIQVSGENWQPAIGFFGVDGHYPDQAAIPNNPTALLTGIIDRLNSYGLTDITIDDVPTTQPLTLTDAEKCNAAYFIANIVATSILNSFTASDTASDFADYLDNLIQLPPFTVFPIWAEIVTRVLDLFTNRTAIEADLADVSQLGADIYAHNFELQQLIPEIISYGWQDDTENLVYDALAFIWANSEVFDYYVTVGKAIDSPNCDYVTQNCEDRTFDLRWNSVQGLDILLGSRTWAEGVHNEFDGVNDYRVDILGYYDACTFNTIRVHAVISETAQAPHLYLWQGPPGALTDQRIILGPEWSGTGVQVWEADNLAQHGARDAWQVRLESEPNDNNNYISKIEVIID